MRFSSLLVVLLAAVPSIAFADAPVIESAAFTPEGKLKVRVSDVGTTDCYVNILGGLTTDSVETSIKGIRVNTAQAAGGVAKITTTRRYYCAQRNLYVAAERICLDETPPGTSEVVRVVVPRANRR